MTASPSAVQAVRSAFRVWSSIFDGRPIGLGQAGVVVAGTREPICSNDNWQRIGGYFTNSGGWLPPATIREHLTDWITNAGYSATTDCHEMCPLVDLGLELSEAALRVWHRDGFAAPTDAARRSQLDSQLRGQREKIVRRIATGFSERFPAATPGEYRYPRGELSVRDRVSQLENLVETVRCAPMLDSLVRQARAIRDGRAAWRDDLPPYLSARDLLSVLDEGSLIAVRDRLTFYLHVLYGPSRGDGPCELTRFDPRAAAKPEHRQMLRVGGRILASWSDACPLRVGSGPDLEHQIADAVVVVRHHRLHGSAAGDEIRNHDRKARVLVDLAVADVIGTALDRDRRSGGDVSRWLAAGCLEAIVAGVNARSDREALVDSVGVPAEIRTFEPDFDEQLERDVKAIVDQTFFDEYGPLSHGDEWEDGSARRA
ncbi:MAG: hypothetical protein ACRDTX_26465 [Pseudonocardiaceae bacterium]